MEEETRERGCWGAGCWGVETGEGGCLEPGSEEVDTPGEDLQIKAFKPVI